MNLLLDNLRENFLIKGFLKKGNTYVFNNSQSFVICNIQKSQFDECVFLNFGVTYKKLYDDLAKIIIHDAHFVGRYEQILEMDGDGISLNLEIYSIKEIVSKINNEILPFLMNLDNHIYIENFVKSDKFFKMMWLQNITADNLLAQLKSPAFP